MSIWTDTRLPHGTRMNHSRDTPHGLGQSGNTVKEVPLKERPPKGAELSELKNEGRHAK